jgi:hypothetical protein
MNNYRADLQKAYEKKVLDKLEKVVRATALIAHGDLVTQTPVGDPSTWKNPAPSGYVGGTAKASWFLDIDTVDIKEVDHTFDNEAEAKRRVQSYTLDSKIFISNNLPYIRRLNDGWSQQAPAGYVDSALTIAKRKADEFARTL